MKIAVRYYTKSKYGNTKKVAEAIAKAVGVEALDMTYKVDNDTDILFMGSSVYCADIDDEVKTFIDSLQMSKGIIYNFSTAAIINTTYGYVKKYMKNKNLNLSEKEFHCKAKFNIMHKNRPNVDDLQSAAEFAKNIVGGKINEKRI